MCINYDIPDNNYTIISNNIITKDGLSVYAKLVYIYLASRPSDWIVRPEKVQKDLQISKGRLTKSYKELMGLGLVKRAFQAGKPSEYTLYHCILPDRILQEEILPDRILSDVTLNKTIPTKTESTKIVEKEEREERGDMMGEAFSYIWKSHSDYRKTFGNSTHGVKSKARKSFNAVINAICKKYKDVKLHEAFEAVDDIVISKRFKEKTQYLQNILDTETILDILEEL